MFERMCGSGAVAPGPRVEWPVPARGDAAVARARVGWLPVSEPACSGSATPRMEVAAHVRTA